MGYHFYNPHENKVSVARYAELFKNTLKFRRSNGSLTLLKASGSNVGLESLQEEDTYVGNRYRIPWDVYREEKREKDDHK
ncbi:hypothetical protein Tco_1473593 [Tanacetum coccineum]